MSTAAAEHTVAPTPTDHAAVAEPTGTLTAAPTAADAAVDAAAPAAATAPSPATPLVDNYHRSGGVCPVKPEYIRTQQAPRVCLDADGKTRGMNKGTERAHTEATAGTQRPTFEGEVNFLNGEVLNRVKAALRTANSAPKRPRDDAPNISKLTALAAPDAATTTPNEVVASSSAATAAEVAPAVASTAPAEGQRDFPVVAAAAVPVAEAVANVVPPTSTTNETETPTAVGAVADLVAQRKAAAASERESLITPPDVLRAHKVQRDEMFRHRTLLAPLTTVGNLPFRRVCAAYGADITLGEMALIYNLNHTQKSEWSLLRRHESEKVFGLQVAVSRPNDALVFAKAIEASGFSYDYIDINCGCPVDKLVQSGCGCGLWEKKGRLREVVANLVKYQSKPVTIKCRIGSDEHNPTLHNQINEYEGWGASAVTIHGRSRKQRYTKLANWSYINQCASLTNLPVIGNGDIMSYEDMVAHREACPNVTSAMLGRGALIKPWVFEEIREGKTMDISSHERFEMLRRFTNYGLAHWGADEKGVLATRRFLCEWLSFLCRYVPVGLLERLPQRINERPPCYVGRDDLETLMASDSVLDWIQISEMLLGPAGDKFKFTPKHKSNSYAAPTGAGVPSNTGGADDEG